MRRRRFFVFCAIVFAAACAVGIAAVRERASRETQITVNIVTYSEMPDRASSQAGTARQAAAEKAAAGAKKASALPTDEEYEAAARIITGATGVATDAESVRRGIEEYNARHFAQITPAEYADMALSGAFADGQVISGGADGRASFPS